MHYLLSVPEFEEEHDKPTSLLAAQEAAVAAGKKAFNDKLSCLAEFGGQLLTLEMQN
jgi:hypothetical protein